MPSKEEIDWALHRADGAGAGKGRDYIPEYPLSDKASKILAAYCRELVDVVELASYELGRWPSRYPEDSTRTAAEQVVERLEAVLAKVPKNGGTHAE
jgi:hypothetical protein